MLHLEILVWKSGSVNRFSTCAVSPGGVSALTHETRDDAMKGAGAEREGGREGGRGRRRIVIYSFRG